MTAKFALHLALSLLWMFLSGNFGFIPFVEGAAVGMGIMFLLDPVLGSKSYIKKLVKVIELILFFLWELVVSNIKVAAEVLTPRFISEPSIVAIPLSVKSDIEITLLANMITLTPGTLSIDVSPDGSVLYVHLMYGSEPDKAIQEIKNGFERRIMEVFA
ncbi:MAG: sodium:proton antiporter [Chlorobiota bacterium]